MKLARYMIGRQAGYYEILRRIGHRMSFSNLQRAQSARKHSDWPDDTPIYKVVCTAKATKVPEPKRSKRPVSAKGGGPGA